MAENYWGAARQRAVSGASAIVYRAGVKITGKRWSFAVGDAMPFPKGTILDMLRVAGHPTTSWNDAVERGLVRITLARIDQHGQLVEDEVPPPPAA